MNKTTKGSLAAGAAAVLLLGGAGSLAFWTDSAIVDGGRINSGFLELNSVPVSATQDCTTPEYAAGSASAGDPVLNFVPGDVISTECTFVVLAEGDNLSAVPVVPDTVEINPSPAAPSFDAEVAATYTLDDAPYTGAPITEANDTDELVATITIEIPYGSADFNADGTANAGVVNGNDTQRIDAILDELTVSLTQSDPNP